MVMFYTKLKKLTKSYMHNQLFYKQGMSTQTEFWCIPLEALNKHFHTIKISISFDLKGTKLNEN